MTTDPDPFNALWRPQYALCQPCSVQYDFIGHYDTLIDDAHHVLDVVGIDRVRFPPSDSASAIEVTSTLVDTMLSRLSPNLLRRLRQFYSADFEMFNFSDYTIAGRRQPVTST